MIGKTITAQLEDQNSEKMVWDMFAAFEGHLEVLKCLVASAAG